MKKVFLLLIFLPILLFSENFTEEEKEWIKNNPTVKISMLDNFEPFSYVSKAGHKGLSFDIVKRIEQISGLKFEIETSHWATAKKNFKEARTDIISDITYTKKRDEFAAFTSAYYEIPTFIFGLKYNNKYEGVQSLKGKTVAVSNGVFYIEFLKEIGADVLELDSSFLKAQAVVTGKADYFLASFTTGHKAIIDNTFYTLKVVAEFTSIKKEDLRFAVHKQNTTLKNILQKSLDEITQEEIRALANKWISNNSFSDDINFTQEELEYIKNKKYVTYSEINWKPLSIIDDNRMKGIMGDYLDLVSKKTGLKFKFIPSDSWEHVLQQFNQGKIDLVPGAGSSPQEKRMGLISQSYAKYPFVIVTGDKYTYIDSLNELKDATIAVPKSYTSHNLILKNYPNIKLLVTDDIPSALLAVEKKEADAFVGHIATSLYYISELHLKNLKISGRTIFDIDHHYLIQRDDPILLSIINKAFNSITLKEKKEINANWMQARVIQKTIENRVIFIIIFTFIVIIAVFIYRQNLLKKYNKQLKDSYDDVQNIINSTMEAILITENRKCIEVNGSAVKLFGYSSKEEMIGQDLLNFIAKDYRKLVKNKILETVKEPYELEILTANGKNVQTLGKGANLKLTGKEVRISSIIDISDLKNKEKLLIEQSKMAALGEMIGNIAHQWRQPLNVITVIASSWEIYDKMGTFDKKRVLDEASTILSNAKYLSQTIDDFRLFIKGENSGSEFDIKELVENLIRLETSSLQNENIQLVLQNNINETIDGSRNKVLQALINIVNNSIDALKNQKNQKLLFIRVFKEDEKHVILEFKDNAGGIDEKIIEKVFEPYFTTKHQSEGTGLGLYMTYTILRNCDATISVSNCKYDYEGNRYKGVKFKIVFEID